MADTMKECRCGVRIPNTWPQCAKCVRFDQLDVLEGGHQDRMERWLGIRMASKHNDAVEPPLGPDVLALLADGISKRAQEASILGLRRIEGLLAHENLKVRYFNMAQQDLEDE